MDQTQTTPPSDKPEFINRLGQALLTALLTVLYFIFILPYKVWLFSVDSIGSKAADKTFNDAFKSDVPFYTSYVIFLNAVIVVVPFIIVLVTLVSAFNSYNGFSVFITGLISAYFAPLWITALKELIALPISIANNIKKLSDK